MTETSGEPEDQLSQEELLSKYRLFIPDRPIEDFEKDKFDHRHFVSVLKRLIEGFDPPFNIGLFGKWGTGKSSIAYMLKKEIGKTAKDSKLASMAFNAWRYPKQLLRKKLLVDVAWMFGAKRNKIYERLTADRHIPKVKTKPAVLWSVGVLIAGAAVFTLLLFFVFPRVSDEIANTLSFWSISIALFGSLTTFIYKFFSEFRTMMVWGKPRTPEEFETLMEQLLVEDEKDWDEETKRIFYGKKRKDIEKLIIFMDDLDRCNKNEILETLEAMKAFLECTDKTIFIVSADDEVIKDAVREQLGPEEGEDYLDKLFQISLRIPPFEEFDFRQYANDLIEKEIDGRRHLMYLLKEQNSESYDNVIYNLIPLGVNNPRSVKKLINTFSLLYLVARARNVELVLNNLPLLAKVAVLQTEFPWFYEMLHESHMLLGKMKKFIVRRDEELLDPNEIKMLRPHMSQGKKTRSSRTQNKQYIPSADDLFNYLSDSAGRWDEVDLRPFLYLKPTHYGDTVADGFLRGVENATLMGRSDSVLETAKNTPRRLGEILELLLDTFRKVQENRKIRVIDTVIRLAGDEKVLSLNEWNQKMPHLAKRIGPDIAELLTDDSKIIEYRTKSVLSIMKYADRHDREDTVDHYLDFISNMEEETLERARWEVASVLIDYDLNTHQRKHLLEYLLMVDQMEQEMQKQILLKACSVTEEVRKRIFSEKFLVKLIKIALEPRASKEEESKEETA